MTEHKKFTLKDFIAYNNPCFCCGEKINFRIGISFTDGRDNIFINPTVKPNFTEVDLSIKYSNTVKLFIFHQTNKILCDNQQGLIQYLSDGRLLYLQSECSKCKSFSWSHYLKIDLPQGQISATTLRYEFIRLSDKGIFFMLSSDFTNESTHFQAWNTENRSIPNFVLDMPLLPSYRFKNKQQLLQKLKTYMTFS